MSNSAVTFETERRVHISLAVSDIGESERFYRALFDLRPSKIRSGYARFEVAEPPLNLSIIQTRQAKGPSDPTSHFGIQVKSTAAVGAIKRRLELAELTTRVEASVNCCNAIQDKVWIVDPDGHRWEIYVVLDDLSSNHVPSESEHSDSSCCEVDRSDPCCMVNDVPCCSEKSENERITS